MPTAADPGPQLHSRLHDIASTLPDGSLGVSVFDYLSGCAWHYGGGRWFHAASTIKVAIMAAVFDAMDSGRFTMESRVHVRNYFLGATDGLPFRVQASRDANANVYEAIGKTMRIGELARHMIASSSNLATNLLLDVTGLEAAKRTLSARGVTGVDLQRGVEDDRAHQAGCNNQVTADGLVRLLRVIRDGDGFTPESSQTMLDILFDQRFAGAIVPGLPGTIRAVARVAHKTGDISTASHDAGLVFLPGRPPYAIALLAESPGEAAERTAALSAASRAVYDAIVAAGEATCP